MLYVLSKYVINMRTDKYATVSNLSITMHEKYKKSYKNNRFKNVFASMERQM